MVKEIFFTARQFNAAEAYEMGLVNRVMPTHMLAAYVADYARRIAENAPLTMNSIKVITQELHKPDAERDLTQIEALVKGCFDSEDYIEGRRAFMEKRKPDLHGR
jgi:enoyl-CoA hydratase/carnithine racemase